MNKKGVGEKVFKDAKHKNEHGILGEDGYDMVTAAACAYIVACQSYAAGFKSFNREYVRNPKKTLGYKDRISLLPEFLPTLKGVEVTNRSVFDILQENQDWSKCFGYFDPPYYEEEMSSNDQYKENWSKEQHERLAELVRDIPEAKFAISGYNNPCYDRLIQAGWKKLFLKNAHVPSSGSGMRRPEYLWVNFEIPDSLAFQVCQWDI